MRKSAEIPQLSTEMQSVYDVLNTQPDLACVVAAAAFLDACLESILGSRFCSRRVGSNLLKPTGPLGNFATRSDLAYCLKLVSKERYKDLRKIGEIRNAFAHSHLRLTFEDAAIQGMCSKLQAWKTLVASPHKAGTSADQKKWAAARNKFSLSVVMLSQWLVITDLDQQLRARRVQGA